MNKILIVAALAALPLTAGAQVGKQVEVTKAYVPSLESASKLAVQPDMTDTTKMRPDIDYTVTPLSLQTALATRPIRPAKVTYWEFNRPRPFYLKAGAGYPLNSVLDFYGSTQNPGTGYLLGYVNHEGRFADIANEFGEKHNSTQMLNRAGVAAGKYFGRRTLEGEISYENRLYHRYGMHMAPDTRSTYMPGSRVDFGDANLALRFGDDFQDLSRTNFEVAVDGSYFMSYPELYEFPSTDPDDWNKKNRKDGDGTQTTLGAHAKIARAFGRHSLAAEAGYRWLAGQQKLDGPDQQQIHAALRYGYQGRAVRFEIGADYYHDKIRGPEYDDKGDYVIPFLRLDFNLGTVGLKPFLEVDGGVSDNSYRSLSRQNPYLAYADWGGKSSVDYNGRLGIGGSLWRERFTYRFYAAFSVRDNHPYWYINSAFDGDIFNTTAGFDLARQTVTSFNGEAEWRPVSPLLVSLGVHGYLYNDDTKLGNGSSAFEGNLGLRYEGRKFSFGVSAVVQSERKWSVMELVIADFVSEKLTTFTAPFAVDLRADLEWKISGKVSLFAEGRNLLNRRLYRYAGYAEYGANFTAGVKLNF